MVLEREVLSKSHCPQGVEIHLLGEYRCLHQCQPSSCPMILCRKCIEVVGRGFKTGFSRMSECSPIGWLEGNELAKANPALLASTGRVHNSR
jgi:hypothetical protein